jgi:hypothetical protein
VHFARGAVGRRISGATDAADPTPADETSD